MAQVAHGPLRDHHLDQVDAEPPIESSHPNALLLHPPRGNALRLAGKGTTAAAHEALHPQDVRLQAGPLLCRVEQGPQDSCLEDTTLSSHWQARRRQRVPQLGPNVRGRLDPLARFGPRPAIGVDPSPEHPDRPRETGLQVGAGVVDAGRHELVFAGVNRLSSIS